MPTVDPFLADITRISLSSASGHGFALGGGNALVMHGIVGRPTEDVDLFTDREGSVRAAAEHVRSALEAAGMAVTELSRESDLDLAIYGMSDAMIEFVVQRGDDAARMSLCGLARAHPPIVMDLGPVMHLDDLIAWKVSAIINRREVRDYIDTAAFLREHSVDDLLSRARSVDPGLEAEDVVEVGRFLDESIADDDFLPYGLTPSEIQQVRRAFLPWPR